MRPALVLASASPRRRELLAALGVEFEVVPSTVPEQPLPGEPPAAFAQRAARDKAVDVACRRPRAFVLAADTVVAAGREVFGKPPHREDACRMLRALSGATHHVYTGVVLISPCGDMDALVVETAVTFRQVTDEEIEAYVDSGECFDKAGAYAVQGGAQKFVRSMRGSRSNVVGLPLDEVVALLRRRGAATGSAARAPQ